MRPFKVMGIAYSFTIVQPNNLGVFRIVYFCVGLILYCHEIRKDKNHSAKSPFLSCPCSDDARLHYQGSNFRTIHDDNYSDSIAVTRFQCSQYLITLSLLLKPLLPYSTYSFAMLSYCFNSRISSNHSLHYTSFYCRCILIDHLFKSKVFNHLVGIKLSTSFPIYFALLLSFYHYDCLHR